MGKLTEILRMSQIDIIALVRCNKKGYIQSLPKPTTEGIDIQANNTELP